LTIPDRINFDMNTDGALELVSTSHRVVKNSSDQDALQGVFSSSKLCSLYDKVLEVLCCAAVVLD
jgi:hypothetical protein